MTVAAFIVAVVSAAVAAGSLVYARVSASQARRSADAATATARLDSDRRHSELVPRFRIECKPMLGRLDRPCLTISFVSPNELGHLDHLTVEICHSLNWNTRVDVLVDNHDRDESEPLFAPYCFNTRAFPYYTRLDEVDESGTFVDAGGS
jgi:hypothetical protein